MNKNFLCVLLCIVLHGTQTIKTVHGSGPDICRQIFDCSYDEEDCLCKKYGPKSTEGAERIYKKKTLEIGVVVSPRFYEVVKKALGQNIGEEMIEKRIKKKVKKMFTKAQRYLLDDSISKTGGFTLVLNGIEILKNYQLVDLEGLTDNKVLLTKFSKYAMTSNPSWDGDKASHDIRILLNGFESSGGLESASGAANTDRVCKRDALAVVTVSLTNGKPGMFGPITLAHEIGHVLGASHDGYGSPCQSAYHIMSDPTPRAGNPMWSTCSQMNIDNGEDERKDCYYT